MATTWLDYDGDNNTAHMDLLHKKWITNTGREVSAPAFEQTATGLKVRVKGTTKSAFMKDFDTFVDEVMREQLAPNNERPWFTPRTDIEAKHAQLHQLDLTELSGPAVLHLVSEAKTTTAWWRFKHADLPISAMIAVHVAAGWTRNDDNTKPQIVSTQLVIQDLDPGTPNIRAVHKFADNDDLYPMLRSIAGNHAANLAMTQPNPALFGGLTFGKEVIRDQRAAVAELLKRVRHLNALPSIDVPDVSALDAVDHGYLTLEMVESNVTGQFLASLSGFLDGEPVVNEINDLYQQMRQKMRKLGIELSPKNRDTFLKALIGGSAEAIDAQLWQPTVEDTQRHERGYNADGRPVDPSHKVHFNLAGGALAVECLRPIEINEDEVGIEWQRAKTIAQLTGSEPELLAYARSYVAQQAAVKAVAHNETRVALGAEEN